MGIRLSLACGVSENRLRPLMDGTVKPQGIDLIAIKYPRVDDLFRRVIQHSEYDISELSLSNFIYARKLGLKYLAIPVFPSRRFRHGDIYVNRKRISDPSDLSGKKVASCSSYYVTAAIWQRGILRDDYGVDPEKINWYALKEERTRIPYPKGITVKLLEGGVSALESAGVEACIGPVKRQSSPTSGNFVQIPDSYERLFQDSKKVERDYYERTKIFPIMHVLVVKEDVWRQNKWIAPSLMAACSESKRIWQQTSAYALGGLVWADLEGEEEKDLLGADPYPYGLKDSLPAIQKLLEYCSNQAGFDRLPPVEELFVDNVP